MEDHAHRDDVGFWQRVGEEVAAGGGHPVGGAGCLDGRFGDRFHDGQVKAGAAQVGVPRRDDQGELAGCATDVAQGLVAG